MPAPSEYTNVAQELYVTYFGRPADYEGLLNMTAALAAANAGTTANAINQQYKTNSTVHTLIDSFGTSAESAALYTGGNTQFVTAIYQNLFNRAPDLPGLNFWINAITSGSETRASAAQAIMAGALQNTTPQGLLDAAMINNKIAVANNFTTAIDTAAEVNAYNGDPAAAVARTMLHQVDAHTSTVAFQPTVIATLQNLVSPLVAGAIVTLTPGVDDTTGMVTSGNDKISTTASNLQIADVVVGGDGTDTLKITVENSDYSASDQLDGTKKVEVHASSVEILKVTDRTTLLQNRSAAGTAQDVNFDGVVGGKTHNADPAAKTSGARDSDTVDTVFAMTLDTDIQRIESLSSEVNGSAVTFNDIQKINVGTDAAPIALEIRIEDTGSAHNFLFDEQAAGLRVGANKDHNDPVNLELSEARDLTINFGETPPGQVANNTLPISTPFANAKNPDVLGENQNDGQGPITSPNGLAYGLVAAAQSKIDTMLIDSQVRGPAGVRQVFRNEVLDLNVGTELKTLDVTGAAQLKVGLAFTVEQELLLNQSTTTIPVANANPDTSGPAVAGPAPYSYGVLPAAGLQNVVPDVLRDFALTHAAYSLDANIRTVDASTHYAGVDQAARALVEVLPVADLTLDFSNGTFDKSAANGGSADKFTYSGSQGDDLINFGVREINKDIRLNAGNDTVVAGRGQDTIRGGDGNDVIKHNNAHNVLGISGEGFAAGASVTVYGGAGNDQVMTAGQITDGQINLIDLGTGNDTLYVDDNVNHDAAANHRIAGGLGADQIVITTAGMVEVHVPEVLDNVIYADVAPGVGAGDDAEHLVSDIVAPGARNVREPFEVAGRVVNAGFIVDSYFSTVQAGGTGDSDTVVITDSSNDYVNLGNGNNSYVHGDLVTGAIESVVVDEPHELVSPGRNSDVVDSGDGNDVVAIYTDGIKQVDTRGGDDVITLKGHGNVTVKAGAGNDDVVINSISTVPTGNQPANYIDLGAGDDTLLISSKGVINGVTEIYGREGRDVVSILNADPLVNTNHTLYVDLGVGADVLEMRARDLMNDDTVFAGQDGSIDQLILRNLGSTTLEYVTASDTARTNGFELIDLRDGGAPLSGPSGSIPDVSKTGVGGIALTVTQHLVDQVDSQVTVGDVTAYVYGVRDVHVLPSDGANQDIATDGEIDDDGLFNAGILGLDTSYMATGVLTITTVEHGANDATFTVESNNDYALTQTVDLRAMGVNSYVNFLGGTARDVVIVDEASMNSFSNLRFDEFARDTRLPAQPWIIDEDNSTLDTLRVVVNSDNNDVADISFGDYRNVQGLDAIVLSSTDDVHAAHFRVEASEFLVNQTTSVLVAGANNAFGTSVHGLLVTVEDGDVATVYSSATGASYSLVGGAIVAGTTVANDFVTVDGKVDIIAVGAHEFLIADYHTV